MRKLCDIYKDRQGITIGNMLAEVEKQKHTDEDVNDFLRYKANSVEAQCKALYSDDDTDTKKSSANSSASKESGASWFTWFSGGSKNAVNCAQSIVKNVSILASSVMYTAPFSTLVMSPVGAVDDEFTCDNNNKIQEQHVCDGINHCGDSSDESVAICCKEGSVVAGTTRSCIKQGHSNETLFVCADGMTTTRSKWKCDGVVECSDESDEVAATCCERGEAGVNTISRSCFLQGLPSEKLFVCGDVRLWIALRWC